MVSAEQPIHFANATLGSERHICAFFHSPDEEYRVLLPFIREGIERGEKAFHIVDPRTMEDHFRRLSEAGIDTEAARQRGQLVVKAGKTLICATVTSIKTVCCPSSKKFCLRGRSRAIR